MSDELKPCPFCGSKYTSVIIPIETEYQVQCGNCYASSSIESTKKKAIKAWNRRTPSDHVVAANKTSQPNPPLTLEELRGMNGEPVYIVHLEHAEENGWVVSNGWDDDFDEFLAANVDGWHAGCYGDSWLAYRRKPEEEGNMNKYCERCYLRDAKPCAECSYCFPGHKNFRPAPASKNNGDRFRSMTNEELAVTLPCPNDMALAAIPCDHGDVEDCYMCLLGWLNRPEKE